MRGENEAFAGMEGGWKFEALLNGMGFMAFDFFDRITGFTG